MLQFSLSFQIKIRNLTHCYILLQLCSSPVRILVMVKKQKLGFFIKICRLDWIGLDTIGIIIILSLNKRFVIKDSFECNSCN
jgi:hypothetical protein